jgi:predicted Zn-dependent protease
MALAGYNPEKAVAFWERMRAHSDGSAPPFFLSTHPSDDTRIKGIQAYIPEAEARAAEHDVKFAP